MRLYVGIDLHANNNYLAIIYKKGKRIDPKNRPMIFRLFLRS